MKLLQPWELGKKYNSNFIFTFAIVNKAEDKAALQWQKFLNMETI